MLGKYFRSICYLPPIFLSFVNNKTTEPFFAHLLIRACDLVNVFTIRSTMWSRFHHSAIFWDLWSQKKCHTVVRINTMRVRLVSRTEMMAWHSREVFQSAVSRSHTVYNGTIQSLTLSGPSWVKCNKLWRIRCRCYTKWCVITINMSLNEDVMDIFREKKFPLTIRAVPPFLKTQSDQNTKNYIIAIWKNTIKFGQWCQ